KANSTQAETSCYGGCLTCSDSNGCLSCKPRYFFLLDRLGMRQVGMCLLSCPSGYYHIRSRDINKCSNCAADCDTCLDEDTCTRCRQGLYLLQGKCHSACPEEFFANEQLMECKPQVHCEVGEWGSWSPCFRGGSTCGFKLGEQIRTRDVLLVTPSNSHPCPAVSEKRDCISKKKKCPGSEHIAFNNLLYLCDISVSQCDDEHRNSSMSQKDLNIARQICNPTATSNG
uniref:R-spondin 3 n=1 Tax=Scleropages formosus TaxID=113540 RepID=A0A8C9WBH5_SCLFO